MTKVLFLASPYKAPFIERMALDFKELDWEINIPNYESYAQYKQHPMFERISHRILGENSLSIVRNTDADLIYTDNAYYSTQAQLIDLIHGKHIPCIVHLRGDWWTEYWSWFEKHASTFRKRIYGTQSYLYQYFGLASAKTITPICRWLEKRVKHNLPFNHTEVVYQGIDPNLFQPNQYDGFQMQHPAVAIIQNHTIYPKVQGLLQFREVIKTMSSVHFYMTSGNRESWEHGYFPQVKEYFNGLSNLHYVENVTWPDGVRNMLGSCDVYCLPSGLDNCPTTILEAGLMEKPVVASNVGGIPELIQYGHTGLIIGNGDTQRWINAIKYLITNRKAANYLGDNGRRFVTEQFAWPKIAAQVERIIIKEA